MDNDEFLWCEKYRPQTVKDTILPQNLKDTFQQFVDNGAVPNLILSGTAGIGKTTISKAMLNQLDVDYIVVNGSLDRNIDMLRNDIANFASSVSFSGGKKYVILDEADGLSALTQAALRAFIEEYSNTGFIFTCNNKNKIIPALHSRCSVVDFKTNKTDTLKTVTQFFKRACYILDQENITYDKAVVAELIKKHMPDWRRIINELQRYSSSGTIDSGILAHQNKTDIDKLIQFLKDKNYTEIRRWVSDNNDVDYQSFYRKLYDVITESLTKDTIPLLVLTIAKYQYQSAFSADQEINFLACLTEILIECSFK